MTDERPFWEGMSEDEIQAHLARVRAKLEAAAALEELERFEQAMDATPAFTWPPMPGTVHPSLTRIADMTRQLMARGKYQVCYHVPHTFKISDYNNEPSIDDIDPIRVLTVQKVWAPAPWTEHPYHYQWRVAVNEQRRWVASEDVEVIAAPRHLGRPQ